VLVPVSSTVIPLPVYKVGFGVGVNGAKKKPTKADEATKLITGISVPNRLLFYSSCTLKGTCTGSLSCLPELTQQFL
jgi:hypothetical protein